ncbi:MAG: 4-hydroxythreonine-4-phosphate dehydrogenase PdxA [Planctomycetota bacterium]
MPDNRPSSLSQAPSSLSSNPVLAISIGDPAGIGPEISLRVTAEREAGRWLTGTLLLFGDEAALQRVGTAVGVPVPPHVGTAHHDDATQTWKIQWHQEPKQVRTGLVHVQSADDRLAARPLTPGVVDDATGRRSYEFVCAAIDAAKTKSKSEPPLADAIVTAPIHKEAWHAAGVRFMGHTELLASRCVAKGDPPADVRMALASDAMACVLETIHVGLADVPGLLSVDRLTNTIRMAADFARRRKSSFDSHSVTLGICGLNPHAGEKGLIGHGEEERLIEPAMQQATRSGLRLLGPLPPDTAFLPSLRSEIDVYVCLYHDQGLIPLKTLAFDEGVNVTLGLPTIRTSVDHGTALELAWQGRACCDSLNAAIRMAFDLTSARSRDKSTAEGSRD